MGLFFDFHLFAQSSNAGKCDGSGACNVTEYNAGMKHLGNYKEINKSNQLSVIQNPNSNIAFGFLKQEELLLPPAQAGSSWVSNLPQSSMGYFQKARLEVSASGMQTKDNYGPVGHPNLNIALGVQTGNLQATSNAIVDEREQRKISDTFHQGYVSPNLLPTPPKLAFSPASDTNPSVIPQMRVARPPVEGRGRHQLLPRYWPRITDQELQQITGEYPWSCYLFHYSLRLVLSDILICKSLYFSCHCHVYKMAVHVIP